MSKKARISELHSQLTSQQTKELKQKQTKFKLEETNLEANIPRGERANFLKVTITLPPEMLNALRIEGTRRKAEGQKDTDVSSLIREAVADMLHK